MLETIQPTWYLCTSFSDRAKIEKYRIARCLRILSPAGAGEARGSSHGPRYFRSRALSPRDGNPAPRRFVSFPGFQLDILFPGTSIPPVDSMLPSQSRGLIRADSVCSPQDHPSSDVPPLQLHSGDIALDVWLCIIVVIPDCYDSRRERWMQSTRVYPVLSIAAIGEADVSWMAAAVQVVKLTSQPICTPRVTSHA